MAERLSQNDVENKLKKYKTINRQIGEKLNKKLMENRKLKDALKTSRTEIRDLRKRCSKWKKKVRTVRDMQMDHANMKVEKLKSNAGKTQSILDECIADVDQLLAVPVSEPIEFIESPQKKVKVGLLEKTFRASVERDEASGHVNNNGGGKEKAQSQSDGGNESEGEGLHNIVQMDEENDGSAEHEETTNDSKRRGLRSRPKRNISAPNFLKF